MAVRQRAIARSTVRCCTLSVGGCRSVPLVFMADDEVPHQLDNEFDASQLHFAAQDGDIARVRQLLAEGRSPNVFDEISKTPLHYAAENGILILCARFWKLALM